MAYNSNTLSGVKRLEPVVSNHLSASHCSHRTGLEMPANLLIFLCSLPVVIKKLLWQPPCPRLGCSFASAWSIGQGS